MQNFEKMQVEINISLFVKVMAGRLGKE